MADKIMEMLGCNVRAAAIWKLVQQEWKLYPIQWVNHRIMSMAVQIVACIADDGVNDWNF